MILGGQALKQVFADKLWTAYREQEEIPVKDLAIGPNSIDVTLSKHILRLAPEMTRPPVGDPAPLPLDLLDPKTCHTTSETMVPNRGLILKPGDFVLGCTNERFDCDAPLPVQLGDNEVSLTFAPMYEGRSTVGRCGVGTHVTAGFGDYTFKGAFTLEIFNVGNRPVRIHPDIRIGQVFFGAVLLPLVYKGAYSETRAPLHNSRPVGPVLGRDRFLPPKKS